MHELTGFELQLAAGLEKHAGPRRPVDALAIAQRAAEGGRNRPMRPTIVGRRSTTTDSWTVLRVVLVAALVTAAFVAGGLFVSALNQPATVSPSPAPSSPPPTTLPSVEPTSGPNVLHSTFSCAEAQAAAARTTTWTAGPPPADATTADNGWIAAWGGEQVPEVFLIDPVSGEACRLARFEGYTNTVNAATPAEPLGWVPPRGPLVWSPDGQALAFVVVGGDGAVRDLYVWSLAGLAGPLITNHDNRWPGMPSWSPDGSLLAAPDIGNHGVGPTDVWILDRDGGKRSIASGCRCHLGQVRWSASGRTIATTTVGASFDDQEDGIVAGSIDGDQLQPIPILQDPASSTTTEQVLGFVDDQTLLLVNPSPQRFTARRTDGGADRDLGPTRLTPRMLEQGPLSLAPDRSAWLYNSISSYGILEIGAGAETLLLGTSDGMVAGWAPNSRAIGYVDMLQRPAGGVWVVNRDGTGTRRVIAGPYVLGELGSLFPWQPVWPSR